MGTIIHMPIFVMRISARKRGPLITVVHIASGDLWAGAEVQLYNLTKELYKNAQVRVLVILLNHGILEKKLEEAGINIAVFDEKLLNNLQILSRIYFFLKKFRPDIVHTHRQKENVLGGFAALLTGIKSLRTVHGAPELRPAYMHISKRFFIFMDWFSGRTVQDKIVAVSKQLADQLTTQFPETKIRVIENGIDKNEVRTAAEELVSLPGPLDAINIAIVGRLVSVKRVDIFLRAAHLVLQRNTNRYAFYIFGDGPLRSDITELIKTLNLQNQVFMMGFCNNIAAYLSKMKLLVITSDHEGLPMNLLEALCLRVLVVSRNVGGIPAVLAGGKCGTLVAGENPADYADAISRCLADPNAAALRAENGYRRVASEYSIQRTAELYYKLYLELLKVAK